MLNKRASILFSPAEYIQLKEKAKEKNTTVSDWATMKKEIIKSKIK